MKKLLWICLSLAMITVGCSDAANEKTEHTAIEDTISSKDILIEETDPRDTINTATQVFFNERFRNVTVLRTDEHKFTISGEAQIFEASFGWIVEDGHNELKKGFATADMGAPEWGKFSFDIDVAKESPDGVLTLVLFETSMKDGSRQYQLAIPLY